MKRLNSKSVYILSTLLLSDKPLSISEIAKQTGYFRQTLDPYITCFVAAGYITNVGISSRNKWIVPENYKQRVLDILINNDVAPSRGILNKLEQKYGKNKWIHLIDADSHGGFPNIALMHLSTFYKRQGHRVTISRKKELGFKDKAPDYIYVSIIFRANKEKFDYLHESFPDTIVDIGGSGYDLEKKLPPEIEACPPDYSLYPKNISSIGFASRGCIRNCSFCIVRQKEGYYHQTQHPSQWYNPAYKRIVFLDNNILADKTYFMELTDWCMEKNLEVWFCQGLDVRLLDLKVAKRLLQMRTFKTITFAWDNIKDETSVLNGIKVLEEAGFTKNKLREKVMFYVYINDDSEYESGVYRCKKLKSLNVNSFVMYDVDKKRPQRVIDLQRWANKKTLYWKFDIEFYEKGKLEHVTQNN
jgi:hypothetical protein